MFSSRRDQLQRTRHSGDPDFTSDQVALIREVQNEQHLIYTETHYTNDAIEPATGSARVQHYRLRVPAEVQTYQLTGSTCSRASISISTTCAAIR